MKCLCKILPFFLVLFTATGFAQTDSLAHKFRFGGQASAFVLLNPDNELQLFTGARYIPVFNFEKPFPNKQLFDLEVSANISGSLGTLPFDTVASRGSIDPYRAWIRYSGKQMEWRAGLQKINFGSASILRPLMWFDQIDPRDPLQLTDGVWGILGRYYFLNNANLWVWGLYGNENRRGWDALPADPKIPEFGTRLQLPVSKGEIGFSYHHRQADVTSLSNLDFTRTPENRFGLDGKWDLKVGLWAEVTWVSSSKNIGILSNQTLVNIGTDYTFGLGNGLTFIVEQLFTSIDENAFAFKNNTALIATTFSYPLGIFDNLNAIFYYDWTHENLYNFLQWQHRFAAWNLHVMAFWNPKNTNLPQPGNVENLFAGKGLQVLAVYKH